MYYRNLINTDSQIPKDSIVQKSQLKDITHQYKFKYLNNFLIQSMDPHGDDDEQVGEDYNPEQEVFVGEGQATLPQLPVQTGEENDEEVAKFRAKIYRFADAQWKERGVGDMKFLKNKQTNKIRLLMRQDKTGKLIANHFITAQEGFCKLSQLKTADKSWIWTCYDASDEQPKVWQLCVRFISPEEVERFKTEFEKAYESNKALQEEVPKNE
ncbi:unnamed protein product (macronuclear) [Paramecium tetraurelia]|uniref:RanBD1 domain-containing protein n=1 Tax=Paramecium tetraurelia TaxID=5888 RepID=A0BHS7_PARTE|nr:uncharacterized protein GSPATT00029130001 [Paramecium tetraurelia]CAK58094.1 unnamed protein product [Paramecium tetraurelia]|eukprot:XP_001425492.1 hypothetical protein (macronuclear) [Paramecium tetraurelia strain d4-2]